MFVNPSVTPEQQQKIKDDQAQLQKDLQAERDKISADKKAAEPKIEADRKQLEADRKTLVEDLLKNPSNLAADRQKIADDQAQLQKDQKDLRDQVAADRKTAQPTIQADIKQLQSDSKAAGMPWWQNFLHRTPGQVYWGFPLGLKEPLKLINLETQFDSGGPAWRRLKHVFRFGDPVFVHLPIVTPKPLGWIDSNTAAPAAGDATKPANSPDTATTNDKKNLWTSPVLASPADPAKPGNLPALNLPAGTQKPVSLPVIALPNDAAKPNNLPVITTSGEGSKTIHLPKLELSGDALKLQGLGQPGSVQFPGKPLQVQPQTKLTLPSGLQTNPKPGTPDWVAKR
jgi:hypothetical protein